MEGLAGAKPSLESVVIDGNVTTSRGLGTAIDFALSLIGQLLGDEKADEIAESVVYKAKQDFSAKKYWCFYTCCAILR